MRSIACSARIMNESVLMFEMGSVVCMQQKETRTRYMRRADFMNGKTWRRPIWCTVHFGGTMLNQLKLFPAFFNLSSAHFFGSAIFVCIKYRIYFAADANDERHSFSLMRACHINSERENSNSRRIDHSVHFPNSIADAH